VTYHPTCHSLRVTRVGDAPLRLLPSVRDLELVELPREQECCGFGGTFSLKNEETSSAMLADKCRAIEDTGADYCTALDGSCLLQIGGGLSRRGSRARPIHLAEIVASA
jgi:L-lactate dehydrogenase complex protein LldE